MRTIYLVRHGESEYNVAGTLNSWPEKARYHLTERGREQIRSVAETLGRTGVDAIFASPLLRTQETAAIIAQATGTPVVTDGRLRETDFGVWNGRPVDEFWARYPSPLDRLDDDPDNGLKGFRDQERRLREFVEQELMREEQEGKRLVVVSHADPLGTLHGILTGLSVEESSVGWHPELGGCLSLEVC